MSHSTFFDRTACHSFTKLLFRARIRHLADQYQSVNSQSSSLNPSHYTGYSPAATHTASHADLPTHSSLVESVSYLPWLTCHLHFATLCLHSNHHTAPAVSWSVPWGRGSADRQIRTLRQRGGSLLYPLATDPGPGSVCFKCKSWLTCVLSTRILLRNTVREPIKQNSH